MMAETEIEFDQVYYALANYLQRTLVDERKQAIQDLKNLLAPFVTDEVVVIGRECVALCQANLAVLTCPNIFGMRDKDGLIPLNKLCPIGPGVYQVDNLVLFAHTFLWVEGPTEEVCFPKIYERIARKPLLGTAILGVRSTGDFDAKPKKNVERVFDLYERLSASAGLIPPAIGYIFDREERTAAQREDLGRMSHGRARFTRRRLYENYLLDPNAIAAIMNSIEDFSESRITPDEIQRWLSSTGQEAQFTRVRQPDTDLPDDWVTRVDGAEILKSLFAEFSEGRVNFSKTDHSAQLTEWLIEHKPEQLRELAGLIEEALTLEANN